MADAESEERLMQERPDCDEDGEGSRTEGRDGCESQEKNQKPLQEPSETEGKKKKGYNIFQRIKSAHNNNNNSNNNNRGSSSSSNNHNNNSSSSNNSEKLTQIPDKLQKKGMTVTSGSITLIKDAQNLIGISIGGGAPYCPCLYVVQIFDNTPAAKDATLAAGDEIVGVNGNSVKSRTKVEVARMIQAVKGEVTINYNKLHADPKQGKSLDIVLKKVKHRLVETMNSGTADAMGLSRAILCNDGLVKKLQEMDKIASMYKALVCHTKNLLKAFFDLSQAHKAFGDVFSAIGVREPQPSASEAFTMFGSAHREIERFAIKMLKTVKPMVSDLNTYLNKAVPDTRLTIKKYLDAKFEYLSYCLKVKEMDDEEYSYAALQEPLYRVETGNYEYRLVLRCRQEARTRFAKMRSDVLVKLELLDNKHVQDIVFQLQRLVTAMAKYHNECHEVLKGATVFPIEVDLSRSTFTYDESNQFNDNEDEDEEEEEEEEEGQEAAEDDDEGERGSNETGKLRPYHDDVDLISTE